MIRVVERRVFEDRRSVDYQLSNGWFINRETRSSMILTMGGRYTLWKPGQGRSAPASFIGAARTLKEVLALASARQDAADANLTKMTFGKEYQ